MDEEEYSGSYHGLRSCLAPILIFGAAGLIAGTTIYVKGCTNYYSDKTTVKSEQKLEREGENLNKKDEIKYTSRTENNK